MKAGAAVAAKIQRQASATPAVAAHQATIATATVPTAQKPSRMTSQRPRFLGGRNSAIIA